MEITVNIKCPDLALAAAALAKAIAGTKDSGERPTPATPQAAVASAPTHAPIQAPATFQAAPVTATPSEANPTAGAQPSYTPAAAMTAPAPVPTAPSPTAVPTSPAPQITGDMVAKAGADLLRDTNNAVYPQLMGLLQKYGVGCAQELRPDQLGAFATELRGLGAKI